MNRKQGYYWVRKAPDGDEKADWEIAFWSVGKQFSDWYITGCDEPLRDTDFSDIDETPVCQRYYK